MKKNLYCLVCKEERTHLLTTHHSGENLMQCQKCFSWRPALSFERKSFSRKKNPVPLSKEAQRKKAELLYQNFTGHEPGDHVFIDKPDYPDVMSVIGDIDGILYTTVRDGVTEKYIHKFKKNSRPLFCVAPDGLSIHVIGGRYEFGERGIVDK